MRAVELAKVAAQAEKIRLQRMAKRQAMRGVYGAAALVFGLCVLTWLHITIFIALTGLVRPVWASLIVLALDVVVAGVLGYLAASSKPGQVEQEAQLVKQEALGQMRQAATLTALVWPVARLVGRRGGAGAGLAGVAAQFMGARR